MFPVISLLITCLLPVEAVLEDHVDVLHRNCVYDGRTGEKKLDQIGGMMWHEDGHFHWDWWRPMREMSNPQRDHRHGGWVVTWYDKKTGTLRQVRATAYIESHTSYDHEMEDRKVLPPHRRRGLTRDEPWDERLRPEGLISIEPRPDLRR